MAVDFAVQKFFGQVSDCLQAGYFEILPASDALTKNYENWKIFI